MTWIRRIVLGVLVLAVIGVLALFATGRGALLPLAAGFVFGAPGERFDPATAAPAPDYADPLSWAALPERSDLADRAPQGVAQRSAGTRAPVDVFFIHPTGYLRGATWTSPMDPNSATEENTQWMLANQASAYQGCCNVYAPRYREASIFTYFRAAPEERERIMRFAYRDVERAFDHYLTHWNEGRPFVIASHSQGTHHGVVLLRERIDGTPLADQMVAAYLIGGRLGRDEFEGMKQIGICDGPSELGCAIHWDTMSERAEPEPERADNVCVNPLTWRRQGSRAEKAGHVGGVPVSGPFQIELLGDDVASGAEFPPLEAPLRQHTWARCGDGVLYVEHQDGVFSSLGGPSSTNYHGLDYPLFHMDLRENAILRTQAFLARRGADR